MYRAIRITLQGDITYSDVDIALGDEISKFGYEDIFEGNTILFRHNGAWIATHSWNLKLIQIDKSVRSDGDGIPFDRIVIDSDKIYGPGRIFSGSKMAEHGVPLFWSAGFETQLTFSCSDGFFVTTDYSIDSIQYPKSDSAPPKTRCGRSSRR